MRVVYIDLHTRGAYVKGLRNIILKRPCATKHRFLLDWMLNNNVSVANLITLDSSIFGINAIKKITHNMFSKKHECKWIFLKNGISKNKIEILEDKSSLRDDDIIICYGTDISNYDITLKDAKGIRVVDQLHFYGDKETADKNYNFSPDVMLYESDLRKYSQLFKKNYSWFTGEFRLRPFAFQERFKLHKEFKDRKTKVLGIGTITTCFKKDFLEEFCDSCYQPKRKMVFELAPSIPDMIDSFISWFEEEELKTLKDTDDFLSKIYKKTWNYLNTGKQKSYFSFDMVDKFNEYKMFICPEDIQGAYGIGVIEGMACGCAMIGWNYGGYEDAGLLPYIHYIPYDGTPEDLKVKIAYYQMSEHQDELEKIAQAGTKFVRENFNQEKIAQNYFNMLKELSDKTSNARVGLNV